MTVRWGVAGPGNIAAGFVEDLGRLDDAEVVAVGSRSAERAEAFGARFDIAGRHASYEELAANPDVDIVYVATPQSRHMEDTLLFLDAGKHVLCEKPFALSSAQGERMVAAARERGLFLMEAMWARFLPSYRRLVEVIADGRIGEPLLVEGDFGWRREVEPTHRLFDLGLGGGCLLDLGIYPVHLAQLVLGNPESVSAEGHIGATGVDESVAAVLRGPGETLAVVKSALRMNMACTARISGTEGVIELPAFMHCPRHLDVAAGGETERIDAGWEGNGLRFQAEEVHRCLADGRLESDVMSLADTLALAGTLDAIRAEIGMTYPDA